MSICRNPLYETMLCGRDEADDLVTKTSAIAPNRPEANCVAVDDVSQTKTNAALQRKQR
jgi:hypothetical protein